MNDGDRSRSYRLEDLDADRELGRLRAQVELLAPRELRFLEEIGLREGMRVVDVGCGPGFFAEKLRARVGDGSVVGVDVDAAMIEVATARTGGVDGLDFGLGTAQRLPLDDDSADLAYARFLFQHLSDPSSVLAEMRRVVRPGGIVAVGDTDDGGLVVHPAPDGFDDFLRASRLAQRDRGGDRQIGRKLKALLLDAGLQEVRARAEVMTSEEIGPDALLAIAVGFKAGVLGPPHATPELIAAVTADLARLSREPGFFGHALGYIAWGRVP